MEIENTYGIRIDLSWFCIVSAIFSVVAILVGSHCSVKSIQQQTNSLIAIFVFIPLLIYRMVAWIIIITLLQTFSLAVFVAVFTINILIFVFVQRIIKLSPFVHSLLSIILPVSMTTFYSISDYRSLKLYIWLVVTGNLTLFGVLAILFGLYNTDVYNP